MTTSWTLPTQFSQYAEEGAESTHVAWNDSNNFTELLAPDNRLLITAGELEHIARSPKLDVRNKTYFLRATGFNFQNLPDTISGIEVRLTTNRLGRAQDDTVELTFNGSMIGENKATLDMALTKIYGGATDLWKIENLSVADLQDSTFGIVIRFQSHREWPHRSGVLINAVEIRIH